VRRRRTGVASNGSSESMAEFCALEACARGRGFYRLASQGFTTSAVRSAKCLTFLVASVARRAITIPAICVSRMSTVLPLRCPSGRPECVLAALIGSLLSWRPFLCYVPRLDGTTRHHLSHGFFHGFGSFGSPGSLWYPCSRILSPWGVTASRAAASRHTVARSVGE
jgi:hypothetical protein